MLLARDGRAVDVLPVCGVGGGPPSTIRMVSSGFIWEEMKDAAPNVDPAAGDLRPL